MPVSHRRKYSQDGDDAQLEATRFHEFGTNEKVEDAWVQESTCHRSRLTIKDTLQKENVIRQLGEEVEEEEALEDGDDEDDAELDEEEDDLLDDLDDEDAEEDEDEEDAVSDAGFDTDDENGFAGSDSENDSDTEWWAPGRSTAATSTDHLEHIRPMQHRKMSDSSLESARDANGAPVKLHSKSHRKTHAVHIDQPPVPDLPDSTDFVCGTLDEDRPLEQAYLSCIEQRKAAKRKVLPQDIDPTFPTSDPEMDEDDDDEEEQQVKAEPSESDTAMFMHGKLDLGEERTPRRGRIGSEVKVKRSPQHSPRRLRSPPPPTRNVHRSPPPPGAKRISHLQHSPPAAVQSHAQRSPPPPNHSRKARLRSPAPPSRLFGSSPHGRCSQPSMIRLTSPPNTRRVSPAGSLSRAVPMTPNTLASRPAPTHTASLPRLSLIHI